MTTNNSKIKSKNETRYLFKIFKSKYCRLVFLISLILVFLLMPKKVFYGYYIILGTIFVLLTSITLTCLVRNIKDKIQSAKSNGASLIGILGIIFGFSALQVCTIGAPVCGATIGASIIALIFPGFAFKVLEDYSLIVVTLSLLIQIFALYYLKCFSKVN